MNISPVDVVAENPLNRSNATSIAPRTPFAIRDILSTAVSTRISSDVVKYSVAGAPSNFPSTVGGGILASPNSVGNSKPMSIHPFVDEVLPNSSNIGGIMSSPVYSADHSVSMKAPPTNRSDSLSNRSDPSLGTINSSIFDFDGEDVMDVITPRSDSVMASIIDPLMFNFSECPDDSLSTMLDDNVLNALIEQLTDSQ